MERCDTSQRAILAEPKTAAQIAAKMVKHRDMPRLYDDLAALSIGSTIAHMRDRDLVGVRGAGAPTTTVDASDLYDTLRQMSATSAHTFNRPKAYAWVAGISPPACADAPDNRIAGWSSYDRCPAKGVFNGERIKRHAAADG